MISMNLMIINLRIIDNAVHVCPNPFCMNEIMMKGTMYTSVIASQGTTLRWGSQDFTVILLR